MMFDLRKTFDLRNIFAVPKDFLKSKIYCSTKRPKSCNCKMCRPKIYRFVHTMHPCYFIGLLRYLKDSTANPAHLAALFCPVLVCPQQATMVNKFHAYFCNSSSSRHEKHFKMLKRLFVVFFCSIKIM